MNRTFRKYHRVLATIVCLPLFLTVISGVTYSILDEWFDNESLSGLLLSIHTMKILHLEKVYPALNGIGVLGLLVTGLTMLGVFKPKKAKETLNS